MTDRKPSERDIWDKAIEHAKREPRDITAYNPKAMRRAARERETKHLIFKPPTKT